ncbi:bifunctional 2-polyprenyl-6-hydroxyphenol methylase/3-demethylubiquinol 3-O-methyltransferase UbiG [Tateyamaria sp. Alg231-49]|uniref:class I SAM-dependent methyltransferase n=1 Tax=Tateyamaria sp. Alg231-49 TaxID=1922219 RepID=UPI000D55927A|nr:class I SAM-dependent methyltransferase [Tateyamaria sp. Alg231-49]
MSDAKTLSVYAAKAAEYAKLTSGEEASPSLLRFISALPQGARTLDIGCGPGFAAGAMAAAGMEAEAWDPVPEMVAMAAERTGVRAREATYSDLREADAYDGIWCNFSMLHTPLTAWPDQFTSIARALKPGGLLHFGTKLGVGEKRDGIGRLYSYMTESALLALLGQTGFTVEYSRTGEEKGLDGKLAPFIVLQARNRA